MEVLEEKPEWRLEVRCRGKEDFDGGCNSLLAVGMDDLKLTHTGSPAVMDFDYSAVCPVCEKEIAIGKENIPASIRRYLESEHIKHHHVDGEHCEYHR